MPMQNEFEQLTKKKQKGFVPYLVAGFPNKAILPDLLKAAARAGATAIELGVPFSDPIADGPVLQNAAFHALEYGITIKEILEIVKNVKNEIKIPILLMGYANPFLQYGWEKLAKDAAASGVSGFIVPDLPLEEAQSVARLLQAHELYFIPLCAPTTEPNRIKAIGSLSNGFVYLIAVKGVTGERQELPDDLEGFIKRTRKLTSKPLYVGFGLSTAEQAGNVASMADGVILGSKIAAFLEVHREEDSDLPSRLEHFLRPWVPEAH